MNYKTQNKICFFSFILSVILACFNCGGRSGLPDLNVGGGKVDGWSVSDSSSSGDPEVDADKCYSCSQVLVSGQELDITDYKQFCNGKSQRLFENVKICVCFVDCTDVCDNFCGDLNKTSFSNECNSCILHSKTCLEEQIPNCMSDVP